MTLNTISISEKPESVKREDWWNVLQNNAKISPTVKALSEGNIQSYISELMQSGRFPSNEDTWRFSSKTSREIYDLKRSRNYFSQEARSILEYSAKKLSKTPDIKTLQNCLSYVSDLLWENTPQAYEVTQIITIYLFSDAQRVHDLWFNIPAMSSKQLEQLKSEKQKYCEELQKLLPNAINIETLSIKDIKTLVMKIKLDENLKIFYGKTDFSELSHKI